MLRIIMHIDFNSYFASCEQQDTVAWRGKPLGVCEHLGGIIIAPSVEAKRWGIKTGTPVWEAKKLYPKIILTKTNPNRYRYYTARFLKVLADYTDGVEKYSIDEAFLDITKACNIKSEIRISKSETRWNNIDPFIEAERIAKEIKARIKKEVGDYLRCSVGVGWNKLVAKIGSDMQKPDGLVVLRPTDKQLLYQQLKLTDIPGIASRQEKRLRALGIRTLLDLRDYSVVKLISYFGIMGYHLHRIGQLEGSWKEEFVTQDPQKSIGHVYTIAQEHRQPEVAELVLYKLCEMVGVRLRANGYVGSIVHVHVWDGEYEYVGKSKRLSYSINDGRDIFFECKGILKNILGIVPSSLRGDLSDTSLDGRSPSIASSSESRRGNLSLSQKQIASSSDALLLAMTNHRDVLINWPQTVKQVGVTVSGLVPAQHQLSLFAFDEKKRRLVSAMDAINQKYEGKSQSIGNQTSNLGDTHEGTDKGWTVARVPVHLARAIIRDSIGFGRMKEFRVAKYAIPGNKG